MSLRKKTSAYPRPHHLRAQQSQHCARACMYLHGLRVLNVLVSALEISERRLAKIPTADANESLRRFKGINISTLATSKLL